MGVIGTPRGRGRPRRRPLSLAAFLRHHGGAAWCLRAHLRCKAEHHKARSWVDRFRLHCFNPALGLALHGDARGQAQRYAAGFRAAAKGGPHLRLHAIHSSSSCESHLHTPTLMHAMMLSLSATASMRTSSFAVAVKVRMSSITCSALGAAAALGQPSAFALASHAHDDERPPRGLCRFSLLLVSPPHATRHVVPTTLLPTCPRHSILRVHNPVCTLLLLILL